MNQEQELKDDRERIKRLIQNSLENARETNVIKVGDVRLYHLIECICFNIDNPNYERKTPKEPLLEHPISQ